MRLFIALLMLIAIGGGAFGQTGPGPTEPGDLYAATVGRVIDGNTLEVEIDLGFDTRLSRQRIRLAGVEAPPAQGRTRPAGIAARNYLRGLLEGKAIIIRPIEGAEGEDSRDDFGRWLGHVYLNGLDVGQHMIDAGFADRGNP